MYIPYEIVWFILGFMAFPIFIFVVWELFFRKKYEDEINDDNNKEG